MPTTADKCAAFRALHGRGRAFLMPNPHDVGTARILASLGFEAIATTSAGFAFTRGYKDACGRVTRSMALDHAAELAAATDLPVNGDLENGFGASPEDVAETVRGAIAAGLAGCSIEDYSQDEAAPYYAFDHAVARIRAAVAAKEALAPDFVLTARAEAPIATDADLEATIERLAAFAAAGADVVYAPALVEEEHIARVVAAVDKPLNVLAGRRNFQHSLEDLSRLGVARVSIGAGLSRFAFGAFFAAAKRLRKTGRFEADEDTPGFADFDDIFDG